MSNPITHGGKIVEWLRRGPHGAQLFTTREAAQASGYIPTHTSSALTSLISTGYYGIRRTRPGTFIYNPQADTGRPVNSEATIMADHFLAQKVLQYVQEHAGEILTINDLAEALPGSKRTSVANALKDASENPEIYLVRLQRGTYSYRPPAAAAAPTPAPVPTPAQVFNPGGSAGKTHTELRGLTTQPKGVQDVVNGSATRAPQRAAQAAPEARVVQSPAVESPFREFQFTVGDKLTVIATEPLLVRARDGKAYKLVGL